jgi:hypothetical protein
MQLLSQLIIPVTHALALPVGPNHRVNALPRCSLGGTVGLGEPGACLQGSSSAGYVMFAAHVPPLICGQQ